MPDKNNHSNQIVVDDDLPSCDFIEAIQSGTSRIYFYIQFFFFNFNWFYTSLNPMEKTSIEL